MHPTLDLGFVQVPHYTALIFSGAVVGLVVTYAYLQQFSRRIYSLPFFLDAALVTFAAGWSGARTYHVMLNWDYYSTRSDQILRWDAGGMGIRGAFIAGLLALALFARWRRVSFARLADAGALGLAIGQAIGWIGALAWGANYGAVSDSIFAVELPNVYGIVEPRVPLQHAAIGLYFLLFFALLALAGRRPLKGIIFFSYLLVSALGQFMFGFFRGDPSHLAGGLRVDQAFDLLLVLIAIAGLAVVRRRQVGINVGNVG